jgi:hypothetical protein
MKKVYTKKDIFNIGYDLDGLPIKEEIHYVVVKTEDEKLLKSNVFYRDEKEAKMLADEYRSDKIDLLDHFHYFSEGYSDWY